MTVSLEKEEIWMQKQTITCENEGRYQSGASTSQAIPQTSSKPAGARREVWNRVSLTSRKGPSSTDTWISSLQPPEL